mmetsp:Transcript_6197/g.22032  ORF Transcript_6197/g.22032 Transcript_6197/m.22032 type:complete len:269 (-) Transcript_6197:62-868(-)
MGNAGGTDRRRLRGDGIAAQTPPPRSDVARDQTRVSAASPPPPPSASASSPFSRLPAPALALVASFVVEPGVELVGFRVRALNSGADLARVCTSWRAHLVGSACGYIGRPRREVPRARLVDGLTVSHDVRGGGTGLEFARNLLVDGNEGWNKWFAHPTTTAWIKLGVRRVEGAPPSRLVGYAVKSANDCPGRDPTEWQLLADGEEVHRVGGADGDSFSFTRRYEWRFFELPAGPALPNEVVMNISRNRSGGGLQMAQISLFEEMLVDE